MEYSNVGEILEELKKGRIVLVADPDEREHEIDMIAACEFATPEVINFMATYAKGLICMPMDRKTGERLSLEMMTSYNTDLHHTAFTVSIDDKDARTGISAFERSQTAMKAADRNSRREDFRSPGHMFPLIARDGGVLEREGHTEATVDLLRLAGLTECGLCCEVMADDGHMMHIDGVDPLMEKFGLKIVTIEQIVAYRKEHNI